MNVTDPRPAGARPATLVPETTTLPPAALQAACGAGYRNGKCYGCFPSPRTADEPRDPEQTTYGLDVPIHVTHAIRGSFFPGKSDGYFVSMYGEACSGFYHSTFVVQTPTGWRRTRPWTYANRCSRVDLPDGARILCITAGPAVMASHLPRFHIVGLRPEQDADLFTLTNDAERNCHDAVAGHAIGLRTFAEEIWSAPSPTETGISLLGIDLLYGRAADLHSAKDCDDLTEPGSGRKPEDILGPIKRARLVFSVRGAKLSRLPSSMPSVQALGIDDESMP
ncbi:MAG: hypothetical protein QM820_61195 [Minicystis sp.]